METKSYRVLTNVDWDHLVDIQVISVNRVSSFSNIHVWTYQIINTRFFKKYLKKMSTHIVSNTIIYKEYFFLFKNTKSIKRLDIPGKSLSVRVEVKKS